MRIRIGQTNELGGGTVIAPFDPPIPFDISSLFQLVEFTTSATSAPPFAQLAINWLIRPIDRTTRIEDYQFRLVAFRHVQLNDIQAQGSAPFTLMGNTRATISGRRNGGTWSTFDQVIIITLDESDCQIIEHNGQFLDGAIFGQLDALLARTKELRFRHETVPVDPQNPNGPRQTIVSEPKSDWTAERIRYTFPLEIVIPNFFDADLDVRMDIRFALEHDATGANFDINVDFKVDASFDPGEHILSFLIPPLGASTLAISETLNKVLPLVFDCRKTEIEAEMARQIIDNRVRSALNALSDGRIFDVRIMPLFGGTTSNYIFVIVCPTSEETNNADTDLVVAPT